MCLLWVLLYLKFLFGERRDIMGSTKCIASIGELSRKDNSLCFKNEKKKHIFKSFSKSYGNGSATSKIKEKDIISFNDKDRLL